MKRLTLLLFIALILSVACAKKPIKVSPTPEVDQDDPLYLTCLQITIIELVKADDKYSDIEMKRIEEFCSKYVKLKEKQRTL